MEFYSDDGVAIIPMWEYRKGKNAIDDLNKLLTEIKKSHSIIWLHKITNEKDLNPVAIKTHELKEIVKDAREHAQSEFDLRTQRMENHLMGRKNKLVEIFNKLKEKHSLDLNWMDI